MNLMWAVTKILTQMPTLTLKLVIKKVMIFKMPKNLIFLENKKNKEDKRYKETILSIIQNKLPKMSL